MAKLTRIQQKVFASQAGSNQIARFGSFAAGSPVLMGPSGVGSIQMLSQYESGWFASVVNGAAPAIEDMNALQYLYAYQLAYGFQEGIPEYDGSTVYFTNSIAKSGSNLYISLADNNTGNAVTNPTYWKLFFQNNIYPDGTALSGTYDGDVLVNGDASLGSDVVVNGSLLTVGDLTNPLGSPSLTVNENLLVEGAFNFTPSDPSFTQSFVWVKGNFNYLENSEYRPNSGQFPYFEVDGGFYSSFARDFDGSGQDEAAGLTMYLGQNLFYVNNISLDGGDSVGTGPGGAGGQILIGGTIIDAALTFTSRGGAGSGTFPAGNGGGILAQSSIELGTFDIGGGSTAGSGDGGGGGAITIDCGNLSVKGATANLNGGDSSGGGNGGGGGTLTVNNGLLISAVTPTVAAGTGGVPGPAGNIFINGKLYALNGAEATPASGIGTISNLPAGVSGDPDGYLQFSINGTQRIIPFWDA